MDSARYAFKLTHFNELAAIDDPYQLLYYVRRDGRDEVELLDTRRKRRHLSRVHVSGLALADIHVGGKVTIFARQYRVADFDDGFTRAALGRAREKAFALLAGAVVGEWCDGKWAKWSDGKLAKIAGRAQRLHCGGRATVSARGLTILSVQTRTRLDGRGSASACTTRQQRQRMHNATASRGCCSGPPRRSFDCRTLSRTRTV